ncbi:phosphopantothenoylcysteine decarboxylase [bacterium]|nr:phosphopantothenoylcysteine decarboxylase [bacterium]
MKTAGKPFEGKTILLGVTGSIAAYKACELVREWIRAGADVHVVMTANAAQFVTPLTFQTLSRNPVATGLFDEVEQWQPGHISLAERGDVLVVAPATANVVAKLSLGLADDALTSLALAFTGPLVVVPAMNTAMLDHPATQQHLATLRTRGAAIVEPEEGELACGSVGKGRFPALDSVLDAVARALRAPGRRQ